EGVTDDERTRHDRGAGERTEDHEQCLAGPAHRVPERQAAQHRTASEDVEERQGEQRNDDHRGTAASAMSSSLTMRPSRMRIMRFALCPTPSSCVTTINV